MRLVAIGGGTGLSTLLRGLKEKVGKEIQDLSAIVTVADSGGSTGRLRKVYNLPAPGDIRNCIVALSESEPLRYLEQRARSYPQPLKAYSFAQSSAMEKRYVEKRI